jgi:hypothetical protein
MVRHLSFDWVRAGLRPKGRGGENRIDIQLPPPNEFVAALVQLAMMKSAQRNCEFVANFAPERVLLCKPKMMRASDGLRPQARQGWALTNFR